MQSEPAKIALRKRAEAFLHENPLFAQRYPAQDLREIMEELRIAYAELEIQNDELRRSQQDLSESRDRYYDLYDFAPIGYCTLDRQGLILEINLAGAKLLGRPRMEVLRRPLSEFVDPEDRAAVTGLYRKAIQEKQAQSSQARLKNFAHGYPLHVRIDCSLDSKGDLLRGFRIMLADITEQVSYERELDLLRRTLEQRVEERTREVRLKAEQLQGLATELVRAEQRERYRIATDLHDYLAQLLVVCRLKLHTLHGLKPGDSPALLLNDLDKALQEAQEYTRTLIADLSPPVLYEQGLAPAMRHLAQLMEEKGLTVHVQVRTDLEPSREAAVLAYQSVRELLVNILKHARATSAEVLIERQDNELCVVVEDSGQGFNVEEATSPAASQRHFGLFSIRQRMESIEGRLDIVSAPGAGTRAIICLPFNDIQKPAQPGRTEDYTPRKPARVTRVLIADDHKVVRETLRRMVEEQPGFKVVGEAENGAQAVELARKLHPHGILMDINMPKVNGIEATRIIKQEFEEVHVVGLSMRDDEDAAREMRRAGACALFAKGSSIDAICDALKHEVRAPRD